MPARRALALGLIVIGLVAGCAGSGGSPSPTVTPTSAITHPSEPTTVILRMATGGGFVAPGVHLGEIPEFTLYGDGTLIVRDPARMYLEPVSPDGIARLVPFLTARLPEAAIQALLADAIGPGGLGLARLDYPPLTIADAPSTTFILRAGGFDKQVVVGALGFEQAGSVGDRQPRQAFQALARRLLAPGLGGVSSTEYSPTAYRGILFDAIDTGTSVPIRAWPWTTFGPGDFTVSTTPGAMQVPVRTLTSADVAVLGLDGLAGGASSIGPRASDGKVYRLALRPLLPDERS